MNSKLIANGILRAIAILVGISMFLYFLYAIQTVIIYILIAAVLSLIGRPFILLLRKKLKFPNLFAVILTMIIMLGMISSLIILFVPLVIEQGKNLSLLEVEELKMNIQNIYDQISSYFSSKGIDILSTLNELDIVSQFQSIPTFLNAFVDALSSLSAGLFSVIFISFFFMKDSHLLKNGILTLIPKTSEKRFSASLEQINDLLSRYFIGLILQISVLFIIFTIVLLSFDISNAVVIAFLCALFNLIPYIGPLIGGFIMFILSMTSNIGQDFQTEILPTSLWILFFYLIAQLLDNLVSQPVIFSKTTKSHPLEIFLIIIICGILFGVIGMMVAVPCYTALKVILKEFLSENKIVKSLTKSL
ncbi:AI-2E family transporter [Polaribacter sp.]|jgi:predicted PurR-regulated permease PerM|uniref:AI-2E family transporter n=1 Tax=Polaribacter sp. TaxID=1920175 RepID=UPI00404806A0